MQINYVAILKQHRSAKRKADLIKELAMLRAKDVMSENVISVTKDQPILDAVKLMVESNISGLPVINDDMTLCGILSEKDVIELFYEGNRAQDKKVGDYMTYPAVCYEANDALLNVCDFLIKNIFRRVPITSEGKLVGIISIRDVLDAVLKQKQETEVVSAR
jgi:CBS domain-containing protein